MARVESHVSGEDLQGNFCLTSDIIAVVTGDLCARRSQLSLPSQSRRAPGEIGTDGADGGES